MLRHSLRAVYEHSDLICLAVDKERRSWSGNLFSFDEVAFRELIAEYDTENKIYLYEDGFYLPQLSARENCNRHRMMIAKEMGPGGWHVQVDCDEYFVDFKGFTNFLKSLNACPTGEEKPYNVQANLYDLFKKLEDGYLCIHPRNGKPFSVPFATTRPNYERARQNGYFNKLSPYYVIHETWARSESELEFKLTNWGHASEELKSATVRQSYINLWKAIDKYNFKYIRDFHFLVPGGWDALTYVPAKTVEDFMLQFSPKYKPGIFYLWFMNNRMIARIRGFFRKFANLIF